MQTSVMRAQFSTSGVMPHCPYLLYTSVARSLDSTQRLSGWRWFVEATYALPAACTREAGVLALTTGMSLTCNTQRLSTCLPRVAERMGCFQQGIIIKAVLATLH